MYSVAIFKHCILTTQSFFTLNEDFLADYWTIRAILSPLYPLRNYSFSVMFPNLFWASIRPPSSFFNLSFKLGNYALLVTVRHSFHLQPSLLCPYPSQASWLGSLWCWRNTRGRPRSWHLETTAFPIWTKFSIPCPLTNLTPALSNLNPKLPDRLFSVYFKLYYYLRSFNI